MQSFEGATVADLTSLECAREVLDAVPPIMQAIRMSVRASRDRDLSVTQIRALSFINRNVKPSLSDAAFHIGLSLPAMSRLVDSLVRKGHLLRHTCPNDRRHIRMELTEQGQAALERAWHAGRVELSQTLRALTGEQRAVVAEAMRMLRPLFDVARNQGCAEAVVAAAASIE